jgi:CheY-like chemotaxis protein
MKQRTILIAESNKQIANAIASEASRRNFAYEIVDSAEQIITRVNRTVDALFDYDLIIANMCFKENGLSLDGLSALHEIRKVFPNLPFIFFSSQMEALAFTEAEKMNASVCNIDEPSKNIEAKVERLFDKVETILQFIPLADDTWNGIERREQDIPAFNRRRRATDTPYVEKTIKQRFVRFPTALVSLQHNLQKKLRH